MGAKISDTQQGSRFKVRFKGMGDSLTFQQVSGLDLTVGMKEIPGGSSAQGPVLVRDRRTAGRIVLSKGSGVLGNEIQKWLNESMNPDIALKRASVEISVSAPGDRKEARRFTLHNAFPFNWAGPLLNTERDEQTIDHISIGFEWLTEDRANGGSGGASGPKVNYPTLSADGTDVKFYCQPIGMKIRHASEYKFLAGPGMARPRPDYTHGRQRILTAQLVADWDLYADSAGSKDAIYKITDTLQGFLKPSTDTLEPPIVAFKYGSRKFEGYLSDLDVTVEKFSSDGFPLRVVYDIALVESFNAPPAENSDVF